MVKQLARREGNILFAGEHTDQANIQTDKGAYLSGKRAAQEILSSSDSSNTSGNLEFLGTFLLLYIIFIYI